MKKLLLFALVLLVASPVFAALDFKDLKFVGHYRLRAYNYNNADLNKNTQDLTRFFKQRIWLGVEGNVAENIFANITLENENVWAKTNGMPGNATNIVYGYLKISKIMDPSLTLTLGRQPYQLNKQNFVLYDNANGLDGIRLNYSSNEWDADAVYFKVDETALVSGFSVGDMSDKEFYGITGTYKGFKDQKVQGYVMMDRDANGALKSDLKRYIGLRGEGKITPVEGLSYIGEYINLGGDNGAATSVDYKASLLYLNAAYKVKDFYSLTLLADYLQTTGDKASNDNEDFILSNVSGVVNLEGNINFDYAMDAYKLACAKNGIGDNMTLSNLKALGIGASIKPCDKLTTAIKWSSLKDKVDGDKIGSNFDLMAKYELGKNYYVCGGYSMFKPDSSQSATTDKTEVLAAEFRVNF